MSAPSTPYLISKQQQDGVQKYVQNCVETLAQTWNLRQQFLARDLLYSRELDRSVEQNRAALSNMAGDPYKMQNLQIPVVMPQVESALAYLASVYLTGYPIFGIDSNPANEDAALQMETIVADNSNYYGWPRELILFLRDGLKYNIGALEVSWKRKKVYTLVDSPGKKEADKTETYYEGNCLKRLDPYNLIWDKRVLQPARVHQEGEFVGYTELLSRVQLKQLFLDLDPRFTMNAKEAFESGTPSITLTGADSWYYIPQVNSLAFLTTATMPTTNWLAWAMIDGQQGRDTGIQYHNIYEVTTLYGRIIPSDFRIAVPQRNQPQIWKFILVNRKIVIYVERMTNAHNNLPILLCQPTEDGLGYQTKSFLDNAAPFQYMSTSLWNSVIESKRRLVFDRLLYDPSRIRKEDIDKVTSVARIPVKQSAYGKPLSESVYAFPYHDENSAGVLQMAQSIVDMADIANGQNKVDRGQFQKGNKTKEEFSTVMGNSTSRQQLGAILLEYQTFTPLKEMLKLNILQYQSTKTLYNSDKKTPVDIQPKDLRNTAMQFKVSDGLIPSNKIISGDVLQVFMQTLQTSPLMQSEFDIVSAFAYWCKSQGAQWFEDFKRNPAESATVMKQLTGFEQAKNAPPQQPGTPPVTGAPNANPA